MLKSHYPNSTFLLLSVIGETSRAQTLLHSKLQLEDIRRVKMATHLGFSIASSIPCSSSSSPTLKRRSFRILCKGSKIPTNPKDPFLKRLANLSKNNPDALYSQPRNPDIPPLLDLAGLPPPMNMSTPAQTEGASSYNRGRRRSSPPDLASFLLDQRVVYIGLPLVPAVTELIVMELMYLQYEDPKAPIYIYINSSGTTREEDGVTVSLETEGFAIYDAMRRCKNEIHTVAIGAAMGQAALILAAGTKGKRFMMPHSLVKIEQPRLPPLGLMQASDVLIRAKELGAQRDVLVKLLARSTGNSEKTIYDELRKGALHLGPEKARRFGVIDKVFWRGQEHLIPENWDPNWTVKMDAFNS